MVFNLAKVMVFMFTKELIYTLFNKVRVIPNPIPNPLTLTLEPTLTRTPLLLLYNNAY